MVKGSGVSKNLLFTINNCKYNFKIWMLLKIEKTKTPPQTPPLNKQKLHSTFSVLFATSNY